MGKRLASARRVGRASIAAVLTSAIAALPLFAVAQIQLSDERIILRNELDVNSASEDYGPRYYGDGLVYVSAQTGKLKNRIKAKGKPGLSKLWYVDAPDGRPAGTGASFLQSGRTRVNLGPVSFTLDLSEVYTTRNASSKRSRGRVERRLQVYHQSQGADGRWSTPTEVSFADPTANDAHPALSPDGAFLVFVSDRDGGFGGMDLWAVDRTDVGWGEPYNLGLGVNSGEDEGFPFVHEDGTLYYAAKRAANGGGGVNYDIVFTRRGADGWTAPIALGEPFNGPADDFGLVVDPSNTKGFFASARPGGIGGDDIYSFEIVRSAAVQPKAKLIIQVTDARSGEGLSGAVVTYLNTDLTSLADALDAGIVSASGDPLQLVGAETYMTDVQGEGRIAAIPGHYLLNISREGYDAVDLPLIVPQVGTSLPVRLSPKQACNTVRVSVLNQATLLPIEGAQLVVTAAATTQRSNDARGELPRTSADGTLRYCVPCGETFALNASLGALSGTPVAYSTLGEDCGQSRTQTTLTIYIAPPETNRPVRGEEVVIEGNPLSPGTKLQLPSVFYGLGDWRLSEAAKTDLDELAVLMSRFPDMRVELGSHTDATGGAALNRRLSQRRADEAKRYLVERRNLGADRIRAVGFGESRLQNGCRDGVDCTPAQHRENRRTEVVILDDRGRGVELRVGYVAPAEAKAPTYLVLAGSFAEREAAETAAGELKEFGYQRVSAKRVAGVSGWTVVAGEYAAETEATERARALREALGVPATVKPQ